MVIEDFPEPCPPLKPNIIVFLFLIIEGKYNVRGKRIFEKYTLDKLSIPISAALRVVDFLILDNTSGENNVFSIFIFNFIF